MHFKLAVKKSKNSFFQSLGTILKSNPKRFWSVVKLKYKSNSSVPRLVTMDTDDDNTSKITAETPEDIANLFNTYFHSVYKNWELPTQWNEPVIPSSSAGFSDLKLTSNEVEIVLRSLDSNKACGPDGLPGYILRECAAQLASSLCNLYNRSLASSKIPSDWKLAHITLCIRRTKRVKSKIIDQF